MEYKGHYIIIDGIGFWTLGILHKTLGQAKETIDRIEDKQEDYYERNNIFPGSGVGIQKPN